MCKKLLYLSSFVFVLGLTTDVVNAELIVYEPFEYTDGTSLIGLNGGTGWGGMAWNGAGSGAVIAAGNLE
ncbi:MAG: hypothetical protein ACYSUX_10775, partial [Planctomycetota bacterium]